MPWRRSLVGSAARSRSSALAAAARLPAAPIASTTAASPSASDREWTTTAAPASTTRRAIPATTPPDAPVTTRDSSAERRAAQLRSPRQRVRARGGDQPLRHPVVDVAEAVEARSLEDDAVVQGAPVELHVGEVLEQDVVRLDVGTLELLASQRGSMHSREVVDVLTDDDAEVLEAHPVDALVNGRDELDERDRSPVEDIERLGEHDQGDRSPVPD